MENVKCAYSDIAGAMGLMSVVMRANTAQDQEVPGGFPDSGLKAIEALCAFGIGDLSVGNLMLTCDPFMPMGAFLAGVRKMAPSVFAYYMLGECIPIKVVEDGLLSVEALESYYGQLGYVSEVTLESASAVLLHVEAVREAALEAVEVCHTWLTTRKTDASKGAFESFFKNTEALLQNERPLEVAQRLMGKQFKRISDYRAYVFVPVEFQSVPCVRYFDEQSLIVVRRIDTPQVFDTELLIKHLKVLSDQTRLEILKALSEKPHFGIELSEKFKVSRPTISHHLELLNSVGLVHIERDKNTKYYSLNALRYNDFIEQLQHYMSKNNPS